MSTRGFVINDGVLEKYTGSAENVVIPDGVKEIGDNAFEMCGKLNGITIPKGVSCIGHSAFLKCLKLTSVSLPDSVSIIADHAFADCSGLKTLTLPQNLTAIGEAAFRGCQITSVIIPSGLKEIGKNAFLRCNKILTAGPIGSGSDYEFPWTEEIPDNAFSGLRKLRKTVLPATIRKVGNNAFKDCRELTDLTMPKSAKVGKTSFKGCDKLGEIKEPDMEMGAAPVIASREKTVKTNHKPEFVIVNSRLVKYNGQEEKVTIPDGVAVIGHRAFYDCKTVKEVTIPACVTTVEQDAFEKAPFSDPLKKVTILGKLESVGKDAFFDCHTNDTPLKLSVYSAIPIDAFTKAAQDDALRTFVRNFSEFDVNSEVFRSNLLFLGTHLKRKKDIYSEKQYYHYLLENADLRRAVLAADAIPAKDLKWLIEVLQQEGQTAVTAEILDYQNRLLSDEKIKKSLEKTEARAVEKALSGKVSAAEWRKKYKYIFENGNVTIVGVKEKNPVIEIPATIGSKKVCTLGLDAFMYHAPSGVRQYWSPKTIILPDTVEEIRFGAFADMKKTEIYMPKTIKTLAAGCFVSVKEITLHLPASIENLPDELAELSGKKAFASIHAPAGSYAEQYAKENDIPFVAE